MNFNGLVRKPHTVKSRVTLNEDTGKYEVVIEGVTSGAQIHFGDGDDGSIRFGLDASRFYVVFE